MPSCNARKIEKAADNRKVFKAFLTDLSKAFDCLPHELITVKINADGLSFHSSKLISNYLWHRKQKVKKKIILTVHGMQYFLECVKILAIFKTRIRRIQTRNRRTWWSRRIRWTSADLADLTDSVDWTEEDSADFFSFFIFFMYSWLELLHFFFIKSIWIYHDSKYSQVPYNRGGGGG